MAPVRTVCVYCGSGFGRDPAFRAAAELLGTALAEAGMRRPTQLVWTLSDPTARPDRGAALFDLIARHERDAAFHVFNEAGHFPYREHPARFNEAVAAFIQGIL